MLGILVRTGKTKKSNFFLQFIFIPPSVSLPLPVFPLPGSTETYLTTTDCCTVIRHRDCHLPPLTCLHCNQQFMLPFIGSDVIIYILNQSLWGLLLFLGLISFYRLSCHLSGKYREGDENKINPPPHLTCDSFTDAVEHILKNLLWATSNNRTLQFHCLNQSLICTTHIVAISYHCCRLVVF